MPDRESRCRLAFSYKLGLVDDRLENGVTWRNEAVSFRQLFLVPRDQQRVTVAGSQQERLVWRRRQLQQTGRDRCVVVFVKMQESLDVSAALQRIVNRGFGDDDIQSGATQ